MTTRLFFENDTLTMDVDVLSCRAATPLITPVSG